MLKTGEQTNRPQAKGGQKSLLKVSVELKTLNYCIIDILSLTYPRKCFLLDIKSRYITRLRTFPKRYMK